MTGEDCARNRPAAVDLFCGAGGLTLGLKQAGFRVISAIENDPWAIDTYMTNHPEVELYSCDIRLVSPVKLMTKLKLAPGELDLLAGCPPCQGFSSIRTLNQSNEIEDDRNDLVFEMLRFAEALKPKAIMMENVPGLAKSPRTTKLVSALGNLGYTTHFDVLDAQKYGVPQRRRRMILVAGLKGRIEFAPATAEKRTVASVIRSLPEPGGNGDPLHDMVVKRTMAVLDRFKVIPKNGGSWRNLPKRYQLECHKKTSTLRGFKDIYGRMSWDDVSPTITGGCTNPSKGRYLHPDEDRAITLREAALLQTFTPGYYISLKGGKVAAMRLVGNALPPEFIRRQSLQIMKYLGDSKRSHGSDRA